MTAVPAAGAEALPERWFPFPATRPRAPMRLVCFAHAGGNAALYRLWPGQAPDGLDIRPLQIPGRAGRLDEPPYRRMEPLAEACVAALDGLGDRPLALFGHSMGAWVAYEVAHRLSALGRPPAHLFVSARRPPVPGGPATALAQDSDEALIALLRDYGGTPLELLQHDELMAALLPAFRADLELLDRYRPGRRAPLGCPITACGGTADPLTPAAELADWAALTTAGHRRWLFPGGHFYLAAARPALLARIAEVLGASHPGGSDSERGEGFP